MSLYGALNAGVSGLGAQGNKISSISDNISNVNTVGYKSNSTTFSSLVTGSSNSSTFSSGGVINSARNEIDQQGLVQSTGIVTDVAISGNGFFLVSDKTDGSGTSLYTRAGSFRADSLGNLVNSSGHALYGWPLDNNGLLPGQTGNTNTTSFALLSSTDAVNINAISGVASATSEVDFQMNLDASESVIDGPGQTIDIISTSLNNRDNDADDIIIPNAASSPNIVEVGDGLTVSASGQDFTFTYGGFEISDNINTETSSLNGAAAAANGLLGATLPNTVWSTDFVAIGEDVTLTTSTSGTVTFNYSTAADSANGTFNSLNSLAEAIDANSFFTARVVSNQLYVAPKDATEAMTFGKGTPLSPKVSVDLDDGTILGASTSATVFSTGATAGDGVEIRVTGTPDDIFRYTFSTTTDGAAPARTFTDMDYLATLITADIAGTAVVAGNQLTITDATIQYIADYNPVGTSDFASSLGINGVDFGLALGLSDTTAATNRFASMDGLANLVTSTTGINSSVTDSVNSDAAVRIRNDDPLASIQFSDYNDGAGSTSAFLAEFGLSNTIVTASYDSTDVDKNMAGGGITPSFSRNIQLFDSLGTGHDFIISYAKLAQNKWAAEVYSANPSEVTSSRTDGLVSSGTISFNGDGTLRSVSAGLLTATTIAWTNKAASSTVTFGFGTAGEAPGTTGAATIGQTDGLRQFDSAFNVESVDQNGVSAGLLSSIAIDDDGFVIANFNNGQSRSIFKLPIVAFANPNGLSAKGGNVYAETLASGEHNLKEAGEGGTGSVSAGSLEQSNVDLADELTQMIVAQRSYQAASKVISTVDELLEELNRL